MVITRPLCDAPPAALNLNRILTGRASRLSRGGAALLIVLTHQLSLLRQIQRQIQKETQIQTQIQIQRQILGLDRPAGSVEEEQPS